MPLYRSLEHACWLKSKVVYRRSMTECLVANLGRETLLIGQHVCKIQLYLLGFFSFLHYPMPLDLFPIDIQLFRRKMNTLPYSIKASNKWSRFHVGHRHNLHLVKSFPRSLMTGIQNVYDINKLAVGFWFDRSDLDIEVERTELRKQITAIDLNHINHRLTWWYKCCMTKHHRPSEIKEDGTRQLSNDLWSHYPLRYFE